MRTLFPLLAILFVVSLADAQTVYKFVDKHGNVVLSDTPVEGAEAITVTPPNSVPMAPAPRPAAAPPPVAVEAYRAVVITTPSHDAVFNNESSPVVLAGASDPGLQGRDQYRFTLNGRAMPPSRMAHYVFNSEERGSFTAVLEIVDSNLQVKAQSAPVTFHVRRHSRLFQKPQVPARP